VKAFQVSGLKFEVRTASNMTTKIQSFEDLKAWEGARKLVKKIYSITKRREFIKDYVLVNQIRRSAISVLSNISEGFERGSNQEFIQFLYIAKASC
jgi:hypothetical protein